MRNSNRARRLMRVGLMIAAVFGSGGPALAQTSGGVGGGNDPFEVFGFLYSGRGANGDGTPPGTLGDAWAEGGSFGGVLDDDGMPVGTSNARRLVDPNWGSGGGGLDPTIFTGASNTNNDHVGAAEAPWEVMSGAAGPAKNDITNVYLHTRTDTATDDLWIFVATEVRSTAADQNVDVEFNQAGLVESGAQIVGSGLSGGRSADDFIISIDPLGGGGLDVSIRSWDDVTTTWVSVDTSSPAGALYAATNPADIPHVTGGAWVHFAGDGTPTSTLGMFQLVEVGVNLSALGMDTSLERCASDSTIMIKTRSSSIFDSELIDFDLAQFSLDCPTPAPALSGTRFAVLVLSLLAVGLWASWRGSREGDGASLGSRPG